ncbi:MAG: phosphate-starvation-inducible PsiE family protein [Nostoc sp. ChiSLP02]|nr:phosphate-starvation-inducible PsiE family protein [Nostoc sp. DedSLP05]MDZ8100244.1 phosphate-starvation-inducible PsiE family protein [Nostoc sp. DedSLP01]MDZ8184004.1 phosphate-starvation-inducible PsiE family protein [Nostoc sp. ChiSLP02]
MEAGRNKNFMHLVEGLVELLAKAMSLLLIMVILVSVIDLAKSLWLDLFFQPVFFFKDKLFEIFGSFLTILIAIELLENITGYLQKHIIQVELVLVTSLIAIARKIIILDLKKVSDNELFGLAAAIVALSIGYGIVKWSNYKTIVQKNHE